MPANVQTMAFYGEVPWHGLGTRVPKGVTAGQMIKAADLDWTVELPNPDQQPLSFALL